MTTRARAVRSHLATLITAEDPASPDERIPTPRQRVVAALTIGVTAGAFAWLMALRDGSVPDLAYPHVAAQLFLDGQNPYALMGAETGAPPPYNEPFFYPFTTVLLLMPFARLGTAATCGLLFGFSSALLAWCMTRDGLWRMHVFASGPFVVAAALGQFGPLLMVMAFHPRAGFLAALKPNLGLALFLRRPAVAPIIGVAVFVAASLIVFPSWPAEWIESLRRDTTERHIHLSPALTAGGFVLLAAVVAWRRSAGRLLLAMSLIPQALFFYDQLPLWLVPRTRKESILLTGLSQAGILVWFLTLEEGDLVVRTAAPFVLLFIYIPALLLVLRPHVRRWSKTASTPGTPAP